LTKSTGKIKFFTAVMNKVSVPEEIADMLDTVDPIPCKVECKKSDDINKDS
jgi:hypothetical protein